MLKTAAAWSIPFFGVSHLSLPTRRFQITVVAYSADSVMAYVLDKQSLNPLTAVAKGQFTSVAAARTWCERQAASRQLLEMAA